MAKGGRRSGKAKPMGGGGGEGVETTERGERGDNNREKNGGRKRTVENCRGKDFELQCILYNYVYFIIFLCIITVYIIKRQ